MKQIKPTAVLIVMFFLDCNASLATVPTVIHGLCSVIVAGATDPTTLFQLDGKASLEFSKYIVMLESSMETISKANPTFRIRFKRSPEDLLVLLIETPNQEGFRVQFSSNGQITELNSPNPNLVKNAPTSVKNFLEWMKVLIPGDFFPRTTDAYNPSAVKDANTLLVSTANSAKLVTDTVARAQRIAEEAKQRLDSSTLGSQGMQSLLRTFSLHVEKYQQSNLERDRRILESFVDTFERVRAPSADTVDYQKKLVSDRFLEALKQRLSAYGEVIYSHGQPIGALKNTIQTGELSSPAIRGLVEGTDCSFVNVCIVRHNVAGVTRLGESLSYARKGQASMPPGVLFLVKPSPLDNYPGQPATRNVVFRKGFSDDRLVKILVPSEMLQHTRQWLRTEGLNEDLAEDYLTFVGLN